MCEFEGVCEVCVWVCEVWPTFIRLCMWVSGVCVWGVYVLSLVHDKYNVPHAIHVGINLSSIQRGTLQYAASAIYLY